MSGSGHFAGFIGQYVFESGDNGVGSLYNWDNGLPSYPLPPQINPSFSNNNTVDHWQLTDAARAPESYYWTFSGWILSVQLFLAGFLGELISRNSTDRNNYQLAEKTGY